MLYYSRRILRRNSIFFLIFQRKYVYLNLMITNDKMKEYFKIGNRYAYRALTCIISIVLKCKTFEGSWFLTRKKTCQVIQTRRNDSCHIFWMKRRYPYFDVFKFFIYFTTLFAWSVVKLQGLGNTNLILLYNGTFANISNNYLSLFKRLNWNLIYFEFYIATVYFISFWV